MRIKADETTVLSVKYGGDTMDNELTMLKYVEDWTKEKTFTFSDTYTFNSDYTEEEAIIYIKHDLKLVAGGGYNTDHIHNVKFEIEKC